MENRTYVCIDLKSFYASVECVERNLDAMTTKLVVADPDRTEKTICLAISPAMKQLGIKNRCRVFQIPKNVKYIMAPPRMQLYIDYSAKIYSIYLKYIASEDIHVYSIDEVFMDVTNYLKMYNTTALELANIMMSDVFLQTGITATCGIGTNLYLAKIALDITAKHVENHIGILNEELFIKTLWNHQPLTDFWRIGPGIAQRLANMGIYTMKEIAEYDEEKLYQAFGIDAELLIDHAKGIEPTTIADIKKYQPKTNSLSSGQVLASSYNHRQAELIIKEMADQLALELVSKSLITDSIGLYIGYDNSYVETKASGSIRTSILTSSSTIISESLIKLFKKIDKGYPIKRINISFNNLVDEAYQQYDLFCDVKTLEKEKKVQRAMLQIKEKYGKNSIVKGMNLLKDGTMMERNNQIGGHKAK